MRGHRVDLATARIDRSRPLSFTFDGKGFSGYAGDTLASALLAHGVRMLARSFKYGRPRGIVGAGPEEPNALVQVETGALTIPNLKATQVELYQGLVARRTTGWPSLAFDLKSLGGRFSQFMPAGFYYKTFKAPGMLWPRYEQVIRHAAGYGSSPLEPDPESYDYAHRHAEVLVIGAGAAGLLAALGAGRAGLDVILLDEQSEPGGWLLSTPHAEIGGKSARDWIDGILAELQSLPNVRIHTRTSAFALQDMNLVQAVEQVADHLPPSERVAGKRRQRLHRIRAERVVLATGAIDRPLVFGNNDLPGIFTAAAITTYLNRYAVAVGRRVLILTNNDHVYQGAADLAKAGSSVVLADTRERVNPEWEKRARAAGVDVRIGYGIGAAHGRRAVDGVHLVRLDGEKNAVAGSGPKIECDAVASSGGLSPTVHLYCHDGGRPQWDDARLAFVAPATGRAKAGIYCVGAVTGEFRLEQALAETHQTIAALLATFDKKDTLAGIDIHTGEPENFSLPGASSVFPTESPRGTARRPSSISRTTSRLPTSISPCARTIARSSTSSVTLRSASARIRASSRTSTATPSPPTRLAFPSPRSARRPTARPIRRSRSARSRARMKATRSSRAARPPCTPLTSRAGPSSS